MPTFENPPPGRVQKKTRRSDATRPAEPVQDEPMLSNELEEFEDLLEKNPHNDEH